MVCMYDMIAGHAVEYFFLLVITIVDVDGLTFVLIMITGNCGRLQVLTVLVDACAAVD